MASKPKPVAADDPPPEELHKLEAKSIMKQVEDMKAEAAPAANILSGSFEKCSQVPRPDIEIAQSDELTEDDVVVDDYPDATGPAAITRLHVGKPKHFFRTNPDP